MHDAPCSPPPSGDTWLAISALPLPITAAYEWAVVPQCGAVVLFSGVVRDHADQADGVRRDGIERLEYEAYEAQAIPKFDDIVIELRTRWPDVGRVALLHRTGTIELGESSVIAVVSAPHRPQAFDAARFAIDALKATAPIWKHETWDGGGDWGTDAHQPIHVSDVPSHGASR